MSGDHEERQYELGQSEVLQRRHSKSLDAVLEEGWKSLISLDLGPGVKKLGF